jgi:hypothetical protein
MPLIVQAETYLKQWKGEAQKNNISNHALTGVYFPPFFDKIDGIF